jgi:hypothetical protein
VSHLSRFEKAIQYEQSNANNYDDPHRLRGEPMASRRDIVRGSVALAALAVSPFGWSLARAETDGRRARMAPRGVDLVVVDRTFREAERFALDATALGLDVETFDSDVAPVWMNALEPRLRAGPLAIAGLTAPGTAFCLEILMANFRAAPIARNEHAFAAVARLAPLLSAGTNARSALPPYAHVARADGDAPEFLTWLIETRG